VAIPASLELWLLQGRPVASLLLFLAQVIKYYLQKSFFASVINFRAKNMWKLQNLLQKWERMPFAECRIITWRHKKVNNINGFEEESNFSRIFAKKIIKEACWLFNFYSRKQICQRIHMLKAIHLLYSPAGITKLKWNNGGSVKKRVSSFFLTVTYLSTPIQPRYFLIATSWRDVQFKGIARISFFTKRALSLTYLWRGWTVGASTKRPILRTTLPYITVLVCVIPCIIYS